MREESEPDTPFRRLIIPALGLILMGTAAVYGAATDPAHAPAAQPIVVPQRDSTMMRHGGIPLEDIRNTGDRLTSAAVENSHGDSVGAVESIVTGRNGRPRLIEVSFGGFWGIGGHSVPLKADTLGYDPRHNVILTDMTEPQLAIIARRRETRAD